jgi:hypothetical protein
MHLKDKPVEVKEDYRFSNSISKDVCSENEENDVQED